MYMWVEEQEILHSIHENSFRSSMFDIHYKVPQQKSPNMWSESHRNLERVHPPLEHCSWDIHMENSDQGLRQNTIPVFAW